MQKLFKRIWHVNKTGDVGAFTLEIDSSALGSVEKDLALKIGSLSELNSNAGRYVVLQMNGNGKYSAVVDLDDEDYFTLATSEDLFSSVNSFSSKDQFRVVPNPAVNGFSELRFNLEEQAHIAIQIMDNSGRIIQQLEQDYELGEQQVELNLSNASSGVYFILITGDKGSATFKLVR